jgi:putative membrane protein
MSDSRTIQKPDRFEVRATADSHFGWIRTRLSVERTMMSWQRTATALIGFGFAIIGLTLASVAEERGRVYRIAAPEQA